MGRYNNNKRKPNRNNDNENKKQKGENGENKTSKTSMRNWKLVTKQSVKFETYYKGQSVIPEGEWDTFMETLKTNLPTTFRVTKSTHYDEEVINILHNTFASRPPVKMAEGVVINPPAPISWYPNNGAWVFSASRNEFRNSREFESFHQFLTTQTNAGNVSRQEAVSMIPPLFMKVEPHHCILDMCAAPGSKTAQLLEALHAQRGEKPPTGIVVANDADAKRCYTLTHQVQRLGSECCLVTNHEAQMFPYIKITPRPGEETPEGTNRVGKMDFQFDRILCDVPCSSDGTFRKNIELWEQWTPQHAVGLHTLQYKIAFRGAQLLKIGGRMVYSTCSLNPLEDEAVVAQILRKCRGALRLVDVSQEIPGLKRHPGITRWKVMDRDMEWYETCPESKAHKLPASLWPPTESEIPELHLERTMRILPHLQDTGGFFIAVFEKVKPLTFQNKEKSENEEKSEKTEEQVKTEGKEEIPEEKEEVSISQEEKIKKQKKNYREEPFRPVPLEKMGIIDTIRNFYGLSENFPINQLWTRSDQMKQISFFSSDLARFMNADDTAKLRVINAGVRVFSLHPAKGVECEYRLQQEGVLAVLPYMKKRVVPINEKDLFTLLNERQPFIVILSKKAQDAMENLADGTVAFVVEPEKEEKQMWKGRVLVGWKGRGNTHLLLPKEDLAALKSLVGITSPGSLVIKEQESKFDRKERIRQQMKEQKEGENKEEETKEEEQNNETEVAKEEEPMEEEK